jgi:hypothetical protein
LLATRVRRRKWGCIDECPGRGDVGWLLLAPAVFVALQFVLLAGGKPPEYARFGLLPDTFLVVSAFAGIALLRTARPRAILAVATTALTLAFGIPCVAAFVRDSRPVTSRLRAAEAILNGKKSDPQIRIVLHAEPAPYCAPPVDLFSHPVVLVPRRTRLASDAAKWVVVDVDQARSPAPISWADTRFSVVHTRPGSATAVSSP